MSSSNAALPNDPYAWIDRYAADLHEAALVFGDAMLRTSAGQLRVCPESWTQPAGGPARLRRLLAGLTKNLPLQHVLVSHGPLVLDDGFVSLSAATA